MFCSCKGVYVYKYEVCSIQSVNLESRSNKSLTSENIHAIHVRTQCYYGTNELLQVFLVEKTIHFHIFEKEITVS